MHRIFRNDRFLLQMAIGLMPHAKLMKAIELFGTRVAPIVRKEIAATMPLIAPQLPGTDRRSARNLDPTRRVLAQAWALA